MSHFYFDPAATEQDVETALQGLALEKTSAQPILGARAGQTDLPPKILFANQAMLALFGAQDLPDLEKRLFSAGDPGAKRLAALTQKIPAAAAARLERLRFYFGLTTQMFTFACRWIARGDQPPVFAAAVIDAPAGLLHHEIAGDAPKKAEEPRNAGPAAHGQAAEEPPRTRDTKPVRFLWRTDAEDRFTEVTPPLADIVGKASADLAGLTIAEVSKRLGLHPRAELLQAFARRETWSGVEVLWPIEGTKTVVPVGLGGLPAFDRNRSFAGYHGFGVLYVDRIAASSGIPMDSPVQTDPNVIIAKVEEASFWTPSFDAENVVLFRPSGHTAKNPPAPSNADPASTHDAAEEIVVPHKPASAADLSFAEQDAFYEIARALTPDKSVSTTDTVDQKIDTAELAASPIAEEAAAPLGPAIADRSEARGIVPSIEAPDSAPEPVSELDEVTRNAAVIFAHLNAGLLVSRNEEPIFINRFLLDLLGYKTFEAFQAGGGLSRLFARPATAGSATVELTTREGWLVPMIASEQCVDWDHLPATLLILQPTERSEIHTAKDTQLAHYESESRELNAILDTATDGVAVLDSEGRILTLNRSGEALFGYDQNEVVGQPFFTLFDAESRAIAEDYLEGLKTHSVKSLLNDGREIVGRARQGGSIPMFMTLGRVSSSHAEDKDLKFCALLRDMTHWKKVEQELDEARQGAERASALKSDFLAKVSHEIRTPLNAILGFAEIIMDERFGPIGNERYKDYLKDIHMSGAHVMSLVNDLLDLSKIEAGRLDLDFHEVDANRIITECVALMQPQANRERVIMRMSLSQSLPHVSADERSLRQIILNLLSNAVKFNEPGGQVIVATASSDSGHAVIRIRDTGIGMSEEDIATALEPFQQIATARQTAGTGLGLPLTKALVEANHAYFSIKSKKQEGTLVEVTFPVMRVSA